MSMNLESKSVSDNVSYVNMTIFLDIIEWVLAMNFARLKMGIV